MTSPQVQKLAPYLWIGAGVFFFLAAALGRQLAFAGVGAMFVMLGVAFAIQARKAGRTNPSDAADQS